MLKPLDTLAQGSKISFFGVESEITGRTILFYSKKELALFVLNLLIFLCNIIIEKNI